MKIRSFDHDKPILYLVATPIGNIKDITLRAIEILKSVDKIYAEDTRNSLILLNHYEIKTHLESYHEFNQDTKSDVLLNDLKNGLKIAIITDAGLPIISDPGFRIVKLARENGFAVSTIPGPSAGISALIASGLNPSPYLFYGFLDSKESKRLNELNDLKYFKHTIIFYEAPHRIKKTLEDMYNVFGEREIVIARELTKKFEEFINLNLKDYESVDELKGEIVILVSGYIDIEININPFEKIDELIKLGFLPNKAIKEVAELTNRNRKELYKDYIDYKNKE